MAVATLTRNGQTTIPKEIRDRLGLKAGDKLRFVVEDDGRVGMSSLTPPVRSLYGIIPAPEEPVSLETDEAIRERVVARSS